MSSDIFVWIDPPPTERALLALMDAAADALET